MYRENVDWSIIFHKKYIRKIVFEFAIKIRDSQPIDIKALDVKKDRLIHEPVTIFSIYNCCNALWAKTNLIPFSIEHVSIALK